MLAAILYYLFVRFAEKISEDEFVWWWLQVLANGIIQRNICVEVGKSDVVQNVTLLKATEWHSVSVSADLATWLETKISWDWKCHVSKAYVATNVNVSYGDKRLKNNVV
jgi:alpha-mannosidase